MIKNEDSPDRGSSSSCFVHSARGERRASSATPASPASSCDGSDGTGLATSRSGAHHWHSMAGETHPQPGELSFAALYGELHALAHRQVRRSRPGMTLDTTALLHEAYLKLAGSAGVSGREHFFALAARAMRQVLVDHARQCAAAKRGGGQEIIALADQVAGIQTDAVQLLEIDAALAQLQTVDASGSSASSSCASSAVSPSRRPPRRSAPRPPLSSAIGAPRAPFCSPRWGGPAVERRCRLGSRPGDLPRAGGAGAGGARRAARRGMRRRSRAAASGRGAPRRRRRHRHAARRRRGGSLPRPARGRRLGPRALDRPPVRPLQAGPPDRAWRNGRRVPRRALRRAVRAAGGPQGRALGARRRRCGAALPRRAPHPRRARASAHRPPARRRGERRGTPLLRDGIRRRRGSHRVLRRSRTRRRPPRRSLPRHLRSGRSRSPPAGRPPRSQALEPARHRRRRGEAARLRDRQAARCRRWSSPAPSIAC